MPSFRTGVVTAIVEERPGLQKVEVDDERAYVLTQLVGPVGPGDRVIVNTTAVDLGLGTGGYHFVHWNLARESWSEPGPGHVMKLRYTSLQVDTGSGGSASAGTQGTQGKGGLGEVDGLPELGGLPQLGGMPVVACDLHSQVAVVAAAFGHLAPSRRLVYVMTDWASLPLALSDLVHGLREREVLAATVTCGHAFGGDYEAVSVPEALVIARTTCHGDAVVIGPGPGAIGDGSRYGYGGVAVAGVLDTTAALGGRAVVAVRYSVADSRARHAGVSHHTTTALSLAATKPVVPVPAGSDASLVAGAVEVELPAGLPPDAGLGVTTMGRGPAQDPEPFRYSLAAGVVAARMAASG